MEKNLYPRIITISGLPGSGKSTIGKMLAKHLDYDYFSVGTFFRELAKERGVDLLILSKEAENNIEMDKFADKKMIDIAKNNKAGIIIDGRIAPWLLRDNKIEAFNIYLEADLKIRAKRIAGRDNLSYDGAVSYTENRQNSEIKRYKLIYNIDITDKSIYDLVIDSSDLTIEDIFSKILKKIISLKKV